jgi:8-oxo-dGTP pyrophosphatase MutT (NUDIX family)
MEVLLMRRHERSTFVPGSWVFPGGVVEEIDREIAGSRSDGDDPLTIMRIAAVRELFEETGVWLGAASIDLASHRAELLASPARFSSLLEELPVDLGQLVWTARWITPAGVPKRFDTYFFLVMVPQDTEASPELSEGVETIWITPSEALERHRRNEMPLVFPTIRNLEAIAAFESAEELIRSRAGAEIRTTRPVLVVDGKQKRIIIPEEGGA